MFFVVASYRTLTIYILLESNLRLENSSKHCSSMSCARLCAIVSRHSTYKPYNARFMHEVLGVTGFQPCHWALHSGWHWPLLTFTPAPTLLFPALFTTILHAWQPRRGARRRMWWWGGELGILGNAERLLGCIVRCCMSRWQQ